SVHPHDQPRHGSDRPSVHLGAQRAFRKNRHVVQELLLVPPQFRRKRAAHANPLAAGRPAPLASVRPTRYAGSAARKTGMEGRTVMNEQSREVMDKMVEKMETFTDKQLNELVGVNYGAWRKHGSAPEEWNPAGDPSHAHDLIDKLLEDGLFVNLYGRLNDWTCEIMDKHANIYAEVTTTTMCRAVCMAALVTVLTKYGEMPNL